MIIFIPTSTTESHYSQIVKLDGSDFILDFDWNQREGKWYLSVSTASDGMIQGPVKVVADWPLIYPRKDPPLPPGSLVAIDTTGEGLDPGLSDFGTRVRLVYLDSEEIGA
jgi:hypothetical protein